MSSDKEDNRQKSNKDKDSNNEFKSLFESSQPSKSSYYFARIVLLRFIAFLYAVAFLIAFNQNKELLGKNGLKPANKFMRRVFNELSPSSLNENFFDNFKVKLNLFMQCPTIFWFFDWSNQIDQLLEITALIGLTLSCLVLIMGSANSFVMFALWLLYHAIVNIGQTWYSFGWESQLLECGFLAIFLVPFFSFNQLDAESPPSFIVILLYRWLIVRIMLGAGLIKVRGDKCWMDLTCMNYHYETQPVPNPLSYFMHKTPEFFHKFEVLVNHFIELIAPFFVLLPFRNIRILGGIFQIKFQILLILSGNLSFLNWLTILPSLACFDDFFYRFLFRKRENSTFWVLLRSRFLTMKRQESGIIESPSKVHKIAIHLRTAVDLLLLSLIAYLSMPVVLNLVSNKQVMNTSYEPFRIVNTYGAFGSVTKDRYEVIFKGSQSEELKNSKWAEYEFHCKPGDVYRRPCVISPYHYRLDWLMWFAAFQSYEYNPWLLSLSAKFLLNDRNFTRQMIASNPFENSSPPKFIKADLYRYEYEKMLGANSSAWWTRKYVRSYLPPITLAHLNPYIQELGWDLENFSRI